MARSTFKVLFYVNGSKEKNGIVPIMGRVTINGTVAQFSCKQNIPKTLWDVKGNKAKGKSREARDINLALDNIKAQIIKHYQRISDREAFVTAEMVRNAYQGIGSEYETLLKAFDRENEVFKKRVGKDRVMATYRARVRARNHVAAFIKSFYRRSDMSMLELTPDFIKEFAAYLSTEAGLRNGSIWANCMWLKGVVMKAHYNGLIHRVNQSCYSLGYRLQLLWQRSNCTIGYSLTIFGSDVLLTVNIAVVLQIDDDTACFGFADGVYLFANLDLLASEIGNSCFGCTFTKYITSLTLQGCGKVGITFIGYHR